jgi:hypothetical protein
VPRIGIVKIGSYRRLLGMLSAGATRIGRIRIEEEPSPSYPDILCDMQESSCRSTPGALNTALDRRITAVARELGGRKPRRLGLVRERSTVATDSLSFDLPGSGFGRTEGGWHQSSDSSPVSFPPRSRPGPKTLIMPTSTVRCDAQNRALFKMTERSLIATLQSPEPRPHAGHRTRDRAERTLVLPFLSG